ncbi:hypothetical protein MYCTH_2309545 [Thermothelomyces thermophilus ATCC 42464]|uniref:N-acetyltransferase domain-containing protein n=1 Tax=Thermothelomyces thermophilus (strain ATCC 42464 / BCRC 31852 / DSM 1799) TaxID=573729 RepID=G2QIP6_THET4|nr:uncharacterized protein MYCTH_2309545 [Thermothelomyces thermophilus ATCC 42464]AEO60368.1 hypothetical protein MYCTH_2309545 [Thermothelomyces thermophilus ATCC 42464]
MIEVKVLLPGDWQLWRELRLQALAEAPHAFGATLAYWQGDGDREQRWRARLAIPSSRNLIAFLGGKPVGMVSGVPAINDTDAVELISLWVKPEARGRGVGGRLVDDVEQWAAGLNLKTMQLSVMPSNEAAIRLYRRHGLRDTGEKGDPTPDGTSREIIMAKPISSAV